MIGRIIKHRHRRWREAPCVCRGFVSAAVATLGLEIGFLFRKVRGTALKAGNGRQEPYVYGSLSGRRRLSQAVK